MGLKAKQVLAAAAVSPYVPAPTPISPPPPLPPCLVDCVAKAGGVKSPSFKATMAGLIQSKDHCLTDCSAAVVLKAKQVLAAAAAVSPYVPAPTPISPPPPLPPCLVDCVAKAGGVKSASFKATMTGLIQ